MKKLFGSVVTRCALLMLTFAGLAVPAFSQTNLGGEITSDLTLTPGGNPYFVTSDLIVNTGVTLTIQPGVVLKFLDLTGLVCNGILVARGTAESPISMGPQNPFGVYRWNGLTLYKCTTMLDQDGNYLSGSSLAYINISSVRVPITLAGGSGMLIEHVNLSNALFGISLNDASGNLVRNCTITNCDYGIYMAGYKKNSANRIIGNTITNTGTSGLYGIWINNSSALSNRNIISGNGISGYQTGIQAGNSDFTGSSRISITGNTLTGNTDAVVLFQDSAVVRGNTFSQNQRGLWCQKSNYDSISGNVFTANSLFALQFTNGSSFSLVLRNTFDANGGDIRLSAEGGDPSLSNLFNFNTLSNSISHIFLIESAPQKPVQFNNFEGSAKFRSFENLTGQKIDATYNFWGSSRESAIDSLIYDVYDEATRGEVIYKPFSDSLITNFSPRYTLSGRVHAGNLPAAGSQVKLYQLVGKSGYLLRDAQEAADGSFSFRTVLSGEYLLCAVPGTNTAAGFAPAYFYDNLTWSGAHTIAMDADTYDVDIPLARSAALSSGAGSIRGYCGSPAGRCSDVTVLLFDPALKHLVGWAQADENGNFSFSGLPFGSYKLAGEKPGVAQFTSQLITLTPAAPAVQPVELICIPGVYKFSIPGAVNGIPGENALRVSPNPCREFIQLEGEMPDGQVVIKLFNSQGTVYNFSGNIDTGRKNTLYLNSLPAGIYVMELSSNGVCVFRTKLVKL